MTTFKRIQHQLRHIFIGLQQVIQYIAKAVTRIFAPTDDQYPGTGVQPFTGEPADKKQKY
ncbi:hypothetical protein I8752_34605 [Nostocaceae cyanobacterium CENA369]|uniref:Uncharacterized protein n=1 Tax=Dendronalium phyllosphericum CENA369 TaxID=1725256 RepID=A0A8J7INC8_9NOST|nr:hypothetical protein [Dendronalium phyllosphericum]MBH8577992.1 hypothetical protein [Dendronalium phyllosphericum CENA369]